MALVVKFCKIVRAINPRDADEFQSSFARDADVKDGGTGDSRYRHADLSLGWRRTERAGESLHALFQSRQGREATVATFICLRTSDMM